MKKNYESGKDTSPIPKKLLLVMKLTAFLIILFTVQVTATVYSQSKKLTIDVQGSSIKEVLQKIEAQSEYRFIYENEKVNLDSKVSIRVKDELVENILKMLFEKDGVSYSITESNLILINPSDRQIKGSYAESSNSHQQKMVSGKVKDSSGEMLPGVSVAVKGTSKGTITDVDGEFNLTGVSNDAILVFSFIGFVTQEISVSNRNSFDIVMVDSNLQIDDVVVTALGMKRSEKALGYATQKVSGDQFEKVKGVNIATSLTGRISGLTVFNSSEFLESSTLKLRGEDPLLVIDGVPYANMTLADIKSDDILAIDVLKGSTAAALYGSRGSSGAVMITTKKGEKEGFSINVNTSNMFNMGNLAMPKVQSSYSAGYNGKYNTDDEVWGDKLDIGRTYSQWDPITKEMRESELTSKGKDNFKNFLEFSMISNTNVSVTQKGKNGSVRSSFSYVYNKGQYPNAKAQQFTYTLGGEMKLGEKVKVEGSLGFNKQIAPNTAGTTYGAQGYIYNILIWTGPEYDLSKYRDYWIKPNQEQNWHYANWYDNPYLMAYEKLNTIDYNKTNGMFSINYNFLSWAKLMLRSGLDYYGNQTTRQAPIGINSTRDWGGTDKGYYQERNQFGFSINNDLILMANKKFNNFSFDGLFGGTIFYYKTNQLQATTKNGLSIPGFYSLKASVESPTIDVATTQKQVNSLFGKLTIGYNNIFYLDITGRNDWSSTLPTNDKSYFYPSIGTSIVMSDLLSLPEWVKFLKVRGSWTVSKSDLEVYAINNAYTVNNAVWNGMNSAKYPTTLRGDVKPITNRTYEVGTAFYLFDNNRVKLDFSYFNKLIYNNTAKVEISSLSGFSNLLINNEEEYVRKGVEFSLDLVPVLKQDFKWNLGFNWSTAKTYYAKIDPNFSPDKLWVYKGARIDAFESKEFLRDSQGNMILYNGFPKLSSYNSKIGYSSPNWVWGMTNSFNYKNFVLSVSIDGRVGGMSNSATNRRMWQTGAHPDSDTKWRYEEVVNGNKTYVADGVKVVSGDVSYDSYGRITSDTRVFEKNTQIVSYETYIKDYWRNGPQLNFDETFFKLRELSLSYDLPKTISSKFGMKSSSVAIVGQNLLLWTKEYKYADPDIAKDDLSSPSVRYLGFNLKLEF